MTSHCNEGQSLFTLVSYTPPPLRNWVVQLRRRLDVQASSQPHVTILPPRPLTMPPGEARHKIISILSGWQSFEIEVSGIRVFPNSNVLYIEIGEGNGALRRLHADLNTGDFAHKEIFEFQPHVTIGGPVPPEDVDAFAKKALDTWTHSNCPSRFAIEEVAFVSISPDAFGRNWRRLWAHKLVLAKNEGKAAQAAATNQTF